MTLRGYVKDGVVVPYEPSLLEEGAEVDIQPARAAAGRRDATRRARPKDTSKRGKSAASKKVAKKKRTTRAKKASPESGESLRDLLTRFTGVMKGLPRDFAANHDHYIHGTPKRK